jgi:hypothetical protein
MIDAKRYLRLKDKGLTDIVKKDDGDYLQFARFDVETGDMTSDPELQKIDREEIKKRQKEIQLELDGIQAFFSDFDGGTGHTPSPK